MPVVIRSDGAMSTERDGSPVSKLRRVTDLRRVVHKIARSGVAPRLVGVQRPDDDVSHAAQRVSYSRFEAVIGVNDGNRPSRAVYAGLALAVLVPLSACSSPSVTHSPTASTSSSRPSTSASTPSSSPDPTASARSEALASYSSYWTAKVASFADPASKPDPKLASFAIDKALAEAQSTVLVLRRAGIAMRGEPRHTAQATAVQLGDPSMVTIQDCLDSTTWTPVYVATGKSALAPGQPTHVIVDSLATVYDGRWVIRESITHKDRPC